jgi:hypothetical protein
MSLPSGVDNWRKSSRSQNSQNCVEVSDGTVVGVRDTKDRDGGQLAVNVGEWSAFLTTVKTER